MPEKATHHRDRGAAESITACPPSTRPGFSLPPSKRSPIDTDERRVGGQHINILQSSREVHEEDVSSAHHAV